MKHVFTLCCSLILAQATAQKINHEVKSGTYRCVYRTNDGRIDGHYVSYYANGQKRAEGHFKDHKRDSVWTIWDSLGNTILQRHYENGLALFTGRTNTCALNGADIEPKKASCRYSPYHSHKEADIIWSKRIWRFIPKNSENAALFHGNALVRQMIKTIGKGQLMAYSGNNDQFAVPFEGLNADTSATVIGYRIKEDWYFDKTRSVMDVQVVGLAPVLQKQDSKDSTNLCWVYFPDLKPLLAGIDVFYCYQTTNMKQVFEHRQFKSEIYKESNVYDRTLADYLPLRERHAEAEKIEMEMIETEHELWIQQAKK